VVDDLAPGFARAVEFALVVEVRVDDSGALVQFKQGFDAISHGYE
jgi:hypothetical protein